MRQGFAQLRTNPLPGPGSDLHPWAPTAGSSSKAPYRRSRNVLGMTVLGASRAAFVSQTCCSHAELIHTRSLMLTLTHSHTHIHPNSGPRPQTHTRMPMQPHRCPPHLCQWHFNFSLIPFSLERVYRRRGPCPGGWGGCWGPAIRRQVGLWEQWEAGELGDVNPSHGRTSCVISGLLLWLSGEESICNAGDTDMWI